jgi:hypothetical protein
MNRNQLVKNVGARVQLLPAACELDHVGRRTPARDDDWLIESAPEDGLRVRNLYTNHVTTLGYDQIHHYTSNPGRTEHGLTYAFLTLTVQVFLQGNRLWVRPNGRPGEPVAPAPPVEPREKWVDFRYPADSGIQRALEAAGFGVAWCSDRLLSRRIELEGWEVAIVQDADGAPAQLRLRGRGENETFMRKRGA